MSTTPGVLLLAALACLAAGLLCLIGAVVAGFLAWRRERS